MDTVIIAYRGVGDFQRHAGLGGAREHGHFHADRVVEDICLAFRNETKSLRTFSRARRGFGEGE
jgi:hypothetical protein